MRGHYDVDPDLDEGYCECCGRDPSDCICPECPQGCGVGDPKCYDQHGLVFNAAQLDGQAQLKRIRDEDMAMADAEAEHYRKEQT